VREGVAPFCTPSMWKSVMICKECDLKCAGVEKYKVNTVEPLIYHNPYSSVDSPGYGLQGVMGPSPSIDRMNPEKVLTAIYNSHTRPLFMESSFHSCCPSSKGVTG